MVIGEGSSATDYVTDVTDVTDVRKKDETLVPRLCPLVTTSSQIAVSLVCI
ncbi:MAG: hypothetical protein WCD53_31540 [Microcoleus sp.]